MRAISPVLSRCISSCTWAPTGLSRAQAVGADGVDRRIDAIAIAMRAGLSSTDLIDLDLAYAPPYGQAKDPVNQTGMVVHNVLTGELVLTGPNELAEDMPVLDVRTVGGVRGRAHAQLAQHPPHPAAGVARRSGRGRAGHGGGLSLRILATKTTRCRSARQ